MLELAWVPEMFGETYTISGVGLGLVYLSPNIVLKKLVKSTIF